MNEIEKQNIINLSQNLVEKGEYEEALVILKEMECVMTQWLKGKIYLSVAEKMSKNFVFIFYPTDQMKSEYVNLLTEAAHYFYNAAFLLPSASIEIRLYLNQYLWNQIARVESELAKNKPCDYNDDQIFEFFDDDVIDISEQRTDSLVDLINDWSL